MSGSLEPTAHHARPQRRLVFASIVFAAAVLAALGGGLYSGLGMGAHAFHGTPYPDAEPAPAFVLTDHQGRQVALDEFRGRAVLLFFGFTHCPDVCPLTLQRLSHAVEALGSRADDVHILLVSVDPERDTPPVLDAYVRRFGPRVTGLTGDAKTLEVMRREYGVHAAMHAGHGDEPPMVMHTDAVFGVDRQGRLRALLHADGPVEQLRDDIRTLLRL